MAPNQGAAEDAGRLLLLVLQWLSGARCC